MRILLTFLFLMVTFIVTSQPRKANISLIHFKYLNLAYASESESQKLDIYLPETGDIPFPVIVAIHGGAFRFGDKRDSQVTPMLQGIENGYAVVSINYRLSDEAYWPAQLHDCKAALRWIRAHAEDYSLDPDRIAVWGNSAGGHLSAMLGVTGGVRELEDFSQGSSDQSSAVQAVVDWYGPTNFLKMDEQLQASGVKNPMRHSVPESPESELIGADIRDAPDLVMTANPESYCSEEDPPFFIQHGLEDPLVPYQGSVNLARRLGELIGFERVSLELFPATGHGGAAFTARDNLESVFRFLDEHLK